MELKLHNKSMVMFKIEMQREGESSQQWKNVDKKADRKSRLPPAKKARMLKRE